ncbi:MAG: 5'/3'-nucleotidase SurE [Dysgonamonadaceae bacterium]|jgi:5'-nucleotidase|nr:5'/3'-nucleotidase SurE [Dysgonamonadaceae bacterium]
MSANKPLILITNDDGITAKGINCLIDAVRTLGEILVVAPDGPRSGMSGSFTFTKPITCKLLRKEPGLTMYASSGTPVDCVKLAYHEISKGHKLDILISGINHGINSACCIFYSATVGAMFEGTLADIPSLAVSLCSNDPDADFTQSCSYALNVAGKILEEGIPKGVGLNLNIPDTPHVKGLKICSQTDTKWIKEVEKRTSENGSTEYWLTGELFDNEPQNNQTDIWAFQNNYAALVPLKLNMTDYLLMKKMKNWEF